MYENALRNFSKADSLKPSLEQEFIIFRYKKLIQDEIDN